LNEKSEYRFSGMKIKAVKSENNLEKRHRGTRLRLLSRRNRRRSLIGYAEAGKGIKAEVVRIKSYSNLNHHVKIYTKCRGLYLK